MDGIVGNVSQGRRGGTGSGVVQERAQFGRITVVGKSGDVKVVATNGLFPKFGQVLQGIYAQAVNGGVVIQATLAPADLASDPKQAASGIWMTDTTLASGAGGALTHKLATALRITFSADATVFLAGA